MPLSYFIFELDLSRTQYGFPLFSYAKIPNFKERQAPWFISLSEEPRAKLAKVGETHRSGELGAALRRGRDRKFFSSIEIAFV
jgi:hypothetical protein